MVRKEITQFSLGDPLTILEKLKLKSYDSFGNDGLSGDVVTRNLEKPAKS